MYRYCWTMDEQEWHRFINQYHPKLEEWWTRLDVKPAYFLSYDTCNSITDDGKLFTVYTDLEM